jgi:hypothetical protein
MGVDVDTTHLQEKVGPVSGPASSRKLRDGRPPGASACIEVLERVVRGLCPGAPWSLPLSERGLFARVLLWLALGGAGALAVIGGLATSGPGLVAVGLAGALAASAAVGIARECPERDKSPLDAAVQAAGGTVGVLLALAGAAVFAGGAVAVLVGGLVAGLVLVLRAGKGRNPVADADAVPSGSTVPPERSVGLEVLLLPVPPPVTAMTTPALGREWLRTTAALDSRLRPAVREAVVLRRQEVLDELERRDAAGFARWLASAPGSDPAGYVRGRALPGGPAAETDAA